RPPAPAFPAAADPAGRRRPGRPDAVLGVRVAARLELHRRRPGGHRSPAGGRRPPPPPRPDPPAPPPPARPPAPPRPARSPPDGRPVDDGRPAQLDATGWVSWAAWLASDQGRETDLAAR